MAVDVHSDVESVLLSEQQIAARVRELGTQIAADYGGRELLCVGVLKGASVFLVDLVRAIDLPLALDFIAVSSYGTSTRSSGVVRILKDLDQPVEGRHLLLVEDVIDTGLTLRYILENLSTRQPASLKVCGLLSKKRRRVTDVQADYVGFEIPDRFVVGYGLDYAERYRNLPYIGVLKPSVYAD